MESIEQKVIPQIGDAFGGGYVGAIIPALGGREVIIFSPKSEGQSPKRLIWKKAMEFCRSLDLGGLNDWTAPTKVEQAAIWVNCGPNHTVIEAFKAGQPEAYDENWYWTSTEYDSDDAWGQYFGVGDLGLGDKGYDLRVRAVRKVLFPY